MYIYIIYINSLPKMLIEWHPTIVLLSLAQNCSWTPCNKNTALRSPITLSTHYFTPCPITTLV